LNLRDGKKTYILLAHAAHGFNQSVTDAQCKVLQQLKLHDELPPYLAGINVTG